MIWLWVILYVLMALITTVAFNVTERLQDDFDSDSSALWMVFGFFWPLMLPVFVISFLVEWLNKKIERVSDWVAKKIKEKE